MLIILIRRTGADMLTVLDKLSLDRGEEWIAAKSNLAEDLEAMFEVRRQ